MCKIKQVVILCLSLTSSVFLWTLSAQPSQNEAAKLFLPVEKQVSQPDFSKIDEYVLGIRTRRNMSEAELVKLITQQSHTKMEKARAIFIWIAHNIAYDTNLKINSKEEALRQGKGVCEAYSGLFKSFAELVGLEVETVVGDSKQSFYKRPSDLDRGGHAWNVVKVDDGRWILVDATWGAGYVENKKFTRKLTTHWFDSKPEIFIFTHFPQEDQWQLLDKPVTRDEFLRMPPLSPEKISWGFNPYETLLYFSKNKDAWFPDVFSIEDIVLNIKKMPISSELKVGQSYDFELVLTQNEEAAIIFNNKDWVRFNRDGDKFSVTIIPEGKGQAILAVKQPSGKFGGVFKYDIK